MEINLSELGLILHGLYMSDYFNSDDLEEALEQMIEDIDTKVSIKNDQ